MFDNVQFCMHVHNMYDYNLYNECIIDVHVRIKRTGAKTMTRRIVKRDVRAHIELFMPCYKFIAHYVAVDINDTNKLYMYTHRRSVLDRVTVNCG